MWLVGGGGGGNKKYTPTTTMSAFKNYFLQKKMIKLKKAPGSSVNEKQTNKKI